MKYRIGMVIGVILLAIGGFTVISAQNYVEALPVVTLTSTVPNSIRLTKKITGNLYYQDVEEIKLPDGCLIEKAYVKTGDRIGIGTKLIQLRERDVKVAYYQKKLEAETLEEAGKEDTTKGKLAFWQLQKVQEELDALERLMADNCEVYAKVDGYVINPGGTQGELTTHGALVQLGTPDGGCYLEWELSASEYRDYSGTAVIGGKEQKLSWEAPVFEDGIYHFRVQLPDVTECIHGEPVEIGLLYVSKEYRAVLPKSCIRYEASGASYVYEVRTRSRNFGKESYVLKVGVTIEEQDDVNVAIKSPLTDIVVRSSKSLEDMGAVTVLEE